MKNNFIRAIKIVNILLWILFFVFLLAFFSEGNDDLAYKKVPFIILFWALAFISRFVIIIKGS